MTQSSTRPHESVSLEDSRIPVAHGFRRAPLPSCSSGPQSLCLVDLAPYWFGATTSALLALALVVESSR